jgi:VIT1/CCC1 family predicted Fe2+/Mn2+ transporter
MLDRQTPHTPAEHRRTTARIEEERQRVARVSKIRQFVFGTLDGLLVPLGVVSGVAGGTGSTNAVIVAGLAEAFAGALSMGFGEFLAGRAEAQVQIAEINKEKEGLETDAEYEFHEMVVLLEDEGVNPEDAVVIAERLARNPHAYVKTMVEKELGLSLEPNTVRVLDGLIMGLSYMAASIVPLIAYFFLPLQQAFVTSLVLTYVCLLAIGIVRGKLARLNLLKSAIEVVAVGTISGLGGYFLGTWLPHLLGY